MSCGCGVSQDSGYFEPCCQEHEWEYVAHLELVSYQNKGICVFCCNRPCFCAEWGGCDRCGAMMEIHYYPEFRQVCDGCRWEEMAEESNNRPQTLADVGMCEADFR